MFRPKKSVVAQKFCTPKSVLFPQRDEMQQMGIHRLGKVHIFEQYLHKMSSRKIKFFEHFGQRYHKDKFQRTVIECFYISNHTLRKILCFHLISWCGNFVESHSFCIVSGDWKYCILCSDSTGVILNFNMEWKGVFKILSVIFVRIVSLKQLTTFTC